MNLDQIRALAGIPMHRGTSKQITEAKSFAPVKADGHFDITVPESAVGKVAIALAKEGLPVDVTYDGMENFFFNFKSSELKDKAAELAKSYVKEDQQVNEDDHNEKVEIHYSPKSPGVLDDVFVLDGSRIVGKLAEALGVPDGWKVTKVGPAYAAFNSGDRLTFFKNQRDFQPDDVEDEGN